MREVLGVAVGALSFLWVSFPANASAEPLMGQSACGFVEGVPATGHPIRRFPALRTAFGLAAAAQRNEARHARAFDAFEKALAPAWKEAAQAFERPVAGADGEKSPFRPERARAFLERWVFSPNAPLRVGDEGFELRAELAASLVQSACLANRRDEAIAIARRLTGAEATSLRAFAALLLLESVRTAEAAELIEPAGTVAEERDAGFLTAYLRAELAADADERRRLHGVALSLAVTPDQLLALDMQARRFE
jgi:hypothetical protein